MTIDRALVASELGLATVDVEEEVVLALEEDGTLEQTVVELDLPLLVAADSSGATIVAVVARRPPLVISNDAGVTWREAGAGLPPGRDVAISPEHPDLVLFAGESRLYLSRDGGRFWHVLAPELPEISAVAWQTEAAR